MTSRIDRIRPDAPALARRGPHPVGVQTHILGVPGPDDLPDRALTTEVWYPAAAGTAPGTAYDTLLRDGMTPVRYLGHACRDATPSTDPAPLVVLSHGYPGNRYLMAHLAEALAARGFVVAAPDHAGSTYDDQQDFAVTLVHRPLDQRGVIDAMAALPGPLGAVTDTDRVGVIGYSMGGYGALVLGGAGLSDAALTHDRAPRDGTLARHRAGAAQHRALADPRIRAILPIGPWGRNHGFWTAAGMAGLRVPMLLMAGTADEVSGGGAMRQIVAETTAVDRFLLSFEHAGHNAAAPVPAPDESWAHSDALGWPPFQHYADPVWDTLRMNNIAQHFACAFMGLHLQGDATMADYLAPGWAGFPPETARGLTLEHLRAGETF
ncbi:Alpha/beta hydrolase family protein [Sulfitobacter sp. THAF37]|uniref:alpha/beta hydrolase family protein n=1 Tax=Sulfitobacter sp. THAF37 TaxID=2587855 RepID=UPI0012695BBD|nr:alpha/beta fold hydrolase [Sulfitobacter sp. THAF37]QFT57222.1 Alpha/beta hydrolase family protein [Sulfitobacter sp. THAF37]